MSNRREKPVIIIITSRPMLMQASRVAAPAKSHRKPIIVPDLYYAIFRREIG